LPETVIERIVQRFGSLHKVLRASVADLDEVEGVGETRAKSIEESLKRLAETSILDRYA
jgi:diadenylate cyclase